MKTSMRSYKNDGHTRETTRSTLMSIRGKQRLSQKMCASNETIMVHVCGWSAEIRVRDRRQRIRRIELPTSHSDQKKWILEPRRPARVQCTMPCPVSGLASPRSPVFGLACALGSAPQRALLRNICSRYGEGQQNLLLLRSHFFSTLRLDYVFACTHFSRLVVLDIPMRVRSERKRICRL
jgi:hypothetical protein